MTAQIIAFKISDYIYVFIFIGFLISFICKSEKVKNIGRTIFSFGLLFLGIDTMGSVMKPLASSPIFLDMIAKVADIPILGVCRYSYDTGCSKQQCNDCRATEFCISGGTGWGDKYYWTCRCDSNSFRR